LSKNHKIINNWKAKILNKKKKPGKEERQSL